MGRRGDRQFSIGPDYDWGMQLFANYGVNRWFARASWTYYRNSRLSNIEDPIRDLTLATADGGPFHRIEAKLRTRYQAADARGGLWWRTDCRTDLQMYANIRWVEIVQRRQQRGIDGAAPTTFVINKEKPEMWGVGAGIGTHGRFCFFQRFGQFGIYGDANFMGLYGERMTTRIHKINDDDATESKVTNSKFIPALQAEGGIDYTWKCDFWYFRAHVGYRLDYYWNAFNISDHDQGFHGVTIGLAGGF